MKLSEFKKELGKLDYITERQKSEFDENQLIIIRDDDSEWFDHYVARIMLDEEYGVYFDYCVPFSKEVYDLIYCLISTPIDDRDL